jgi:zinc protease
VEAQVAQEVSAAHYSQAYGGVFLVEITPADGQTLESVEAAVQAEIDRLATEGPTPEELARVRTNLQTDALRGLESLQDRASALNRYFVTRGEPDSLAWDLSRTAAVDAEAVKAAAARLTVARRATLRVRPEAAATPEAK